MRALLELELGLERHLIRALLELVLRRGPLQQRQTVHLLLAHGTHVCVGLGMCPCGCWLGMCLRVCWFGDVSVWVLVGDVSARVLVWGCVRVGVGWGYVNAFVGLGCVRVDVGWEYVCVCWFGVVSVCVEVGWGCVRVSVGLGLCLSVWMLVGDVSV